MAESNKAYIGHILVSITIIIYSFNTNFMKTLLPDQIGAFGLVVFRCLITTAVFWIASLFIKENNKPTLKEILLFSLAGLLGIGVNLLLYLKGLELTGPIDAMVIRTLQPIVLVIIGALFLHQKTGLKKIIGIILGIIGTIYVAIAPHTKGVSDSITGDIYVLISTIGTSLFLIILSPYSSRYKAITIMKWMSLASLVITIPFGTKDMLNAQIFQEAFSIANWGKLLYTTVFASVIGYLLSVESLRYISPLVKSSYIYIMPITGTLVSMLLKIQYPNWHDPIAFTLILIGFVLINKKEKIKK